uniref:Putative 60S ribosomal protein L14 n=1 Tax=Aegilops tauschii TaxID=37682 RepID=M8BGV6_AEGTA
MVVYACCTHATISWGVEFDWHCLPPRGRSGGILLGVKCESLEVVNVVYGDFAVKFRVRSKIDGFRWALVAVYGAAQPEFKPDLLADLVKICGDERLLILVGEGEGVDFNIIRRGEEKNNDNFDGRWSFMFNTIIESLDLREIDLTGRQFTWADSLSVPTYEKLDRVLTSVEWEQKFPLVTPFKRFVLIGRVALVNYGKDYSRLVVIVDVVDQNRNVEDTVHREVEIMQHLSGHPAVVTLKAVCSGCKSKLKGRRRLGVRDYISLLSFIFCPKYKCINLIMGFSVMAAKRQHGVEMQVVSTLKALRSVGVLGSMQSIGDVVVISATATQWGDASDQAAAAYSLGDLHKGAAKISNDILDYVGISFSKDLGIYETKTDFCIISRIDFLLLDMFVGMCKNRVSVYATTKNSTTIYATNGAICVRCNLLILTRVECPTFPKMAPKTCPQPEPAKLPYKKLGDSDLLISETTLGIMIFGEQSTEKESHDMLSYSFNQVINILHTAEIAEYMHKTAKDSRQAQYIGVSNETPYGVMQFVHAEKLDGLPKIMSI